MGRAVGREGDGTVGQRKGWEKTNIKDVWKDLLSHKLSITHTRTHINTHTRTYIYCLLRLYNVTECWQG